MSQSQPRLEAAGQDDVPSAAPQTTPRGVGMGHPEYHFAVGLMEVNRSLARVETILENVKQTTEDTKGKVARLEKIAYAAGVIAVICIAVGGWMLNAAKDFAMTYYKATLDSQVKQAAPAQPTPPTKAPKP